MIHQEQECPGDWDSTIETIGKSAFGWYMDGDTLENIILIEHCPFCGIELKTL
jgi:hypothetical protein